MTQPKLGMHYEDVRKRVKRISKLQTKNIEAKNNLVNSLLGQAEMAEGINAKEEIIKEVNLNRAFSGKGNKQIVGIKFCKVCQKVKEYCICGN